MSPMEGVLTNQFDTNTADHEIELASPDQGDANIHVDNNDTEQEISSDDSDEKPANDEHEDNMHEGTSSRHVRGDTLQRQTVFGEDIPGSIGVPSGRTSYYNTKR
ncbi:Alpha/beta-Hydrolases superfamily protein isoform 1 [Dorcoceras hygrometricum]|uniref:Alpha/beta-Hydrolases superfamily protein isoform 1 n=1 Tax=Dorcoceras hygrometricum TaxID=472368 RepID=A0A2Z7AP23_9LAMI|nr:Alpha/beta-Hydrolases superfamily protein isoform 1 [Dorcoceras hygrometricum]